jgi:hypothetical protein
MRNAIRGLFQLLVLAALAWGAWWGWQAWDGAQRPAAPARVLDIDKACRLDADSGQCICRHERTGERLSVPYDECRRLARGR